jgi:hypothetical protein
MSRQRGVGHFAARLHFAWLLTEIVGERGVVDQGAEGMEEGGSSGALDHVDVDQRVETFGEAEVSGEQKDGHVGLGRAHMDGDFGAAHAGHEVIEDDGVDGLAMEEAEAFGTVGGGEHLVSGVFEQRLAHSQTDDFVVDTEDQFRCRCGDGRHEGRTSVDQFSGCAILFS